MAKSQIKLDIAIITFTFNCDKVKSSCLQ